MIIRKNKNKHNNSKKKKIFLIILLGIFGFGMSSGLFLLYGSYNGFRDWLITTAMQTMNHQYLATWFYSDEVISEVLARNNIVEPEGNTDTSLIDLLEDEVTYKDDYEKEILEHKNGESYKIIEIDGDGYSGYLAAIYDPSKIKVIYTKNIGYSGEYLVDMARDNNAVLAINGGGFEDVDGLSNGGQALGTIISDGKIISDYGNSYYAGGIIGFTNDNKLYLGKISAEEAIEMGIRDAVEFGPFLIVNGESAFINGNGGYGTHPRTAIAQRKDGFVLFLVIDGRRIGCMGADMNDMVEVLLRYGAYNAANLDGGNSSVMVENFEIINHPINWDNLEATRPIASGFGLIE